MMKKGLFFGLAFVLLGLLLCFVPSHIAPVCAPMKDGGFMKCHWTGQSVRGLGVVTTVLGAVFMIVKNEGIRCGLSIAGLALALLTILIPMKLIGTCSIPTMGCNMHMRPAVYLIAGICIVLHAAYIFLSRKELTKR